MFNSTLSGTTVEDFNSMPLGANYNVNIGFGSINAVDVVSANVSATGPYGGTPVGPGQNDQYAVQTKNSGEVAGATAITQTILTLNTPSSYFGMYWSAGDANNFLNFYNGSTLVGSFSTQSLMDKLPSGYYGNPNPGTYLGADAGEPFGFVNFFATPGTTFTSVTLSDNTGSGFESDNWTTRVNAYSPTSDGPLPGTPVALITGTNTTLVNSVSTNSSGGLVINLAGGSSTTLSYAAASAPGAPAPPMAACLAFATVLALQALRSRKTTV